MSEYRWRVGYLLEHIKNHIDSGDLKLDEYLVHADAVESEITRLREVNEMAMSNLRERDERINSLLEEQSRLKAENEEMRECLEFYYYRLLNVHSENENYDYMHKGRKILKKAEQ